MKRYSTALALMTSVLMFFSCIFEDQSDCPPSVNVDLTFSYYGDTKDPSMFKRMIGSVDLYVFSAEDHSLFYSCRLNRERLAERQGVSLNLPEGKYRAYSWGNVGFNSAITGQDFIGTWAIAAPDLDSGNGRIATNDHLYQGGIEIDVPSLSTLPEESQTTLKYDIRQCGAHINFEIYVKGIGDINDLASFPAVKIGKLMPQYGVDLKRMRGFDTDYLPEISWDAEHGCAKAVFQTLRFENDNDIVVTVLESIENPIEKAKVQLRDFISENNIPVSGMNEVTIYMLVEFTNLGVMISIPEWTKIDITPDLP